MNPTTYMTLTANKKIAYYVCNGESSTGLYTSRKAAESAWKKGLIK